MDLATLLGLLALLVVLLVGIGPQLALFVDPPSLVVAVGGGLALTLISLPWKEVSQLSSALLRSLLPRSSSASGIIRAAVGMAHKARAEGIVSLEEEVRGEDPFLAAGIRLAVDGTEPDLIMDILETELQFIERRHAAAQRAVTAAGRNTLIAGGLGTLMAPIIVDGATPIEQWLGIGVLPLFYGLLLWGLALAAAHKLQVRGADEKLCKQLVIEAVMSIQSGDNPRVVEHKLSVFLPPAQRPSSPGPAAEMAQPFVKNPQLVAEVATRLRERPEAQVVFDDLADLTRLDVQRLLRAVDQKDLVMALVAAGDGVSERLLGGMSSRVRQFMEEEMAFLTDLDADLIADRQAAIVQQALRMGREGQIQFPRAAESAS